MFSLFKNIEKMQKHIPMRLFYFKVKSEKRSTKFRT